MTDDVFSDLFVLEMTNNHLGDVKRGLEIINIYSDIVKANGVRAAIKLQFREIETFIHREYKERTDIRYIKRIKETQLSKREIGILVATIVKSGCIAMATPFDENSVTLCSDFDLPIIKIASADSNDWPLITQIAELRKPVIASVAGLTLEEIDGLVDYFTQRRIPLAINHCVSAYPTEDHELQLNQIDLLRSRYPNHTIGLSAHDYRHITDTIQIAYAKGARMFERHIDIEMDDFQISPYSSLPNEIDAWFKAYHRAKVMCGDVVGQRVSALTREIEYFNSYVRGVFAKHDLKPGQIMTSENTYLAIPLQDEQISTREITDYLGREFTSFCKKDSPIRFSSFT